MNLVHLFAIICSFITLLIHIYALSSVFWVHGDMYFFGLWVICVEKECTSYGMRPPAYIHITRAFMLISTATGTITYFFLLVAYYYPITGYIVLTVISVTPSLLGGFCNLIAMAIFTVVSMRSSSVLDRWFSTGFFFGWASVPLSFIVAMLTFKLAAEERNRRARQASVSSG